MFQIYLGGSITPRSLMFSASSPAQPPESQESFESRKRVKWRFHRGAFTVLWRVRRSTCWSGAGAEWPCFSHGWFPGEPWPETWGRRWTEASAANCSRFLQRAAVPSLRTHRKCQLHATSAAVVMIELFKIKGFVPECEPDLVWWTELLSARCCWAFHPL